MNFYVPGKRARTLVSKDKSTVPTEVQVGGESDAKSQAKSQPNLQAKSQAKPQPDLQAKFQAKSPTKSKLGNDIFLGYEISGI